MVRVRIFIEGGGSGKATNEVFITAWTKFFAAGLAGRMLRIVRGESRGKTFDKFQDALHRRRRDEVIIMLVDSEGSVVPGHNVWQHLGNWDNWNQPPEAGDESAYLMVQLMETWFLADRDTLRRFFGPSINENRLREWQNLEEVPKDTVLNTLEQATRDCQKPYRKGRISFELLGQINPQRVSAACPHAEELLNYLRGL